MKFLHNENTELIDLGGGVKRRVLAYGKDLMTVEVYFEEGAVGSEHTHPHAQDTFVLEGEFEFTVDGETAIVKRGDMVYMEAGVPHGCKCLKKGILLDTFNPMREDFLK